MGINTYEVMYIQAKDNYPYNVEECIEKLQYVIAADNEHAGAQCLMGRIYEEQLEDFKQAEYHYRMTLYLDKDYGPVYGQYAMLLIRLNRLEEALKIIGHGMKVPGMDLSLMYSCEGMLYEKYEMYETSIQRYTAAKKLSMSNYCIETVESHIKRVKDKKAWDKKLKKKDGKKEKAKS